MLSRDRVDVLRLTAERLKTTLPQYLKHKRVYGYGASTKGNVLLQFCGLGHTEIIAIADRNPQKWGRYTPGTNIPICSEETMRDAKPEVLLVLPWAFIDEFTEREQDLLAAGTTMLVPFPELKEYRFSQGIALAVQRRIDTNAS